MDKSRAVIIGVGDGLSASLARELATDHYLTLAARSSEKMREVATETGAETILLDATDEAATGALFDALPRPPRVVIYNPSSRVRGPVAELDVEDVRRAMEVTAIGAFLAGKHAARRMLEAEPLNGCRGTILFTGASAGVKGFPQSAPFAMSCMTSPRVLASRSPSEPLASQDWDHLTDPSLQLSTPPACHPTRHLSRCLLTCLQI